MFSNFWQPQPPTTFLLQNLPNFPYREYYSRQSIYEELNDWFSGEKLIKFDIDQATGRRVELYPLPESPRLPPLLGFNSRIF